MDWRALVGHRISALIVGKDGKIENYVGKVLASNDKFIQMEIASEKFPVESIIFNESVVQSLWIYKDQESGHPSPKKRD